MPNGGKFGPFVASSARRRSCIVALLVLCASVFGGSAAAQEPASGTESAQSIDHFLTMPGDQVVTVPDGTYTASALVAKHDQTNGRLGGWLVLVAQHRGGVVVDLSTAPERQLWFQDGTSRIAFVGFSFRNGVIRNEGQFMRFWYTDHQDADYDYLDAKRETPRMLQTYNNGDDLEVYGSDFHKGTATAVFFGSLINDITIQGVRIYDIDPKFGDVLDPTSHIVPMGSPEGAHKNVRVLDTYLEGFYTLWGTNSGSNSDLTWQNIWYGFGYPSPFLLQVVSGRTIERATRLNWQIFGPEAELSKNGNDPYIYVDDKEYSGPDALQHKDRIDLTDTNVNYGYPAGVSDPASAQASPQNPAALWRAEHPYGSWPSFFGWSTASTSNHRKIPFVLIAVGVLVLLGILFAVWRFFGRPRRPDRPGQTAAPSRDGDAADGRAPAEQGEAAAPKR